MTELAPSGLKSFEKRPWQLIGNLNQLKARWDSAVCPFSSNEMLIMGGQTLNYNENEIEYLADALIFNTESQTISSLICFDCGEKNLKFCCLASTEQVKDGVAISFVITDQ